MKKQLSLLIFCFMRVGVGLSQPIEPAQINAQLVCFEGNLSIELHIGTKDSIQASPGMLSMLNDSSYLLRNIAAGQIIQIRQFAPAHVLQLKYLVPEIEVGPVLPPLVSGSVLCDNDSTAVLQALVSDGQTVDWYDAPAGGKLLASGTLKLTVTKAGEYYAESRNSRLSCLAGSHERTLGVVRLHRSLCPTVLVSRIPPRRNY